MNIKALSFIIFIVILPATVSGQRFVVTSDNAQFVDAINGTNVISAVPRNTQIYGLERKDRWVKAVDPKTKTVGWISRDSHLALNLVSDEKKAQADLIVKKERKIEKYGIDSPVTKKQLQDSLQWAKELRDIYGELHPVTLASCQTAAGVSERANAHSTTEFLYQKSLEISLNLYGNKSKRTAYCYKALAYQYLEQRELAKTAKNAKQAIMIYGPLFGYEDPRAAECWIPLAHSMYISGEYADALGFYSNAEAAYTKSYGKFDLKTICLLHTSPSPRV